MSELDDLLARSRAPGRLVERRRFTLARERAIEKMREFTLRDPAQYLLELVEAAVLAGASWVAVDVRPESVLVGWVGCPPIPREIAENLYDALFYDQRDRARRAWMQLAVGVNALQRLEPSSVWVESGDGTAEGTFRLELGRRGEAEIGRPLERLAGTYVAAHFDLFSRASRHVRGSATYERGLVETRALYTPVPILLNGEAPFGFRGGREVRLFGVADPARIEGDGRRGAVGLASRSVAAEVRLVVGGVWVASRDLTTILGAPIAGVVADPRLRKTADMSDIVEDDAYVDLLHALAEALAPSLRAANPKWRPVLPERARAAAETPAPRLEPLPEVFEQAGARPALTLAALRARPPEAPVFVIHPDLAGLAKGALDPLAFPWPVLLLTEGAQASLSAAAPELSAHRMGSSVDVAFVRRNLGEITPETELSAPLTSPVAGTLRLRWHGAGRTPDWGGAPGGLPLAVRVRGEVTAVRQGRGGLPGLSAIFDADGVEPLGVAELLALEAAAIAHAWRLLRASGSDTEPRWRQLTAALLGLHARPFFVAGAPAPTLALAVGGHGAPADVLARPLAATPAGTLCANDLVALMGTDERVDLVDEAEREALRPLERLLGFGHLRGPSEAPEVLAFVGRVRGDWRRLDAPTDAIDAALWVERDFGVVGEREGWRALPRPSGQFGALAREAVPVSEEELQRAWGLLLHALARQRRDPPGPTAEATHAQVALARLRLTTWLERPLQGLLATDGREVRALAGHRVIAAHGVQIVEPRTVALRYDALRALSAPSLGGVAPAAPTLRFDDAPAVWSMEEPDPGVWLVRRPAKVGLLTGWLGLRMPFDPTMGVLIEGAGELRAVSDAHGPLPVHGWLWDRQGAHPLDAASRAALDQVVAEVYAEVVAGLRGDWDAERRATGLRYAAHYAQAWVDHHGPLPERGLARSLAEAAGLADLGPPLPRGEAADDPAKAPPSLDRFHEAILATWGDALQGWGLEVWHDTSGTRPIQGRFATHPRGPVLVVWLAHVLVREALAGDHEAQELLLLAACPELAHLLEQAGSKLTLADFHARLTTRWISGLSGWD